MKPTILIEEDVYKKVMHWVNKSQFEVSGLGTVKVEKDGVLRVVSAMLLPQKNGSAHTDIEAEDVNKALYQLRESEGDLRWWWHSHVQMGVFWSGTDQDTIKKIGAGGWFAASVFNQKKEVKSCYYGAHGQATPWGHQPLMLDDLTTKVTVPADSREAEWDAEYELNVTNQARVWSAYEWQSEEFDYSGNEYRVAGKPRTAIDPGMETPSFDPALSPPLKRPKGMPKKTFKEWNSAHVAYMAGKLAKPAFPQIVPAVDVDDYGFTQEERTLLAKEGWNQSDVEEMLDEDFTPLEIIEIAKLEVTPHEISYLMQHQNYDHSDIMELVAQSVGFGENLFNQPQTYRTMEMDQ